MGLTSSENQSWELVSKLDKAELLILASTLLGILEKSMMMLFTQAMNMTFRLQLGLAVGIAYIIAPHITD